MNIASIVKLWHRILNGLFPLRCLRCQKVGDQHALCLSCRAQVPAPKLRQLDLSGVDQLYYVCLYEDWVKHGLHDLKFKRRRQTGLALGRWALNPAVLNALPGFDLLVPVPLHWSKRWQRGFNQVDILFASLIAHSRLPYISAIRRQRRTPPLFGLSRLERREVMKEVFGSARDLRAQIAGQRILILDDIVTTGATVGDLAQFLKSQGAGRVSVLALAYTPLGKHV